MLWLVCMLAVCHRFGIEQEYTILNSLTKWPLGWPANGYPAPQVRLQLRYRLCAQHAKGMHPESKSVQLGAHAGCAKCMA